MVDPKNLTAVKNLCEGFGFLSEMPEWMYYALGFVAGLLFCLLVVQVWQLVLIKREQAEEKAEKEKFKNEEDKTVKELPGGGENV